VATLGPLAVDGRVFAVVALFAITNTALINMIMASRLTYGMAREGIVPGVLGRLLPGRRTPWVAIAFTTAIGLALVATGDLGTLADMTVTLLLLVFAVVNVSVLVLRRDPVDHEHFVAPRALPILGVVVSPVLATQEPATFLRAGILLAIGVVLWMLNQRFGGGRREMDTGVLQAVEHPAR
jgi:amino acid transporter